VKFDNISCNRKITHKTVPPINHGNAHFLREINPEFDSSVFQHPIVIVNTVHAIHAAKIGNKSNTKPIAVAFGITKIKIVPRKASTLIASADVKVTIFILFLLHFTTGILSHPDFPLGGAIGYQGKLGDGLLQDSLPFRGDGVGVQGDAL